jgi:hypothetical protein
MTPKDKKDREDAKKDARLTVIVHNEDEGGKPFKFHEKDEAAVATVIADLYRKLKTDRNSDDRLVCIGSGESVLPYEEEKLGDYATRCEALEWGWSRKTGGA